MIQKNERVLIVKDKKVIGYAYVKEVCKSLHELKKYYHEEHPCLPYYQLAMENDQSVYIVNFDHDGGQAGYLRKHLKKIKNKAI